MPAPKFAVSTSALEDRDSAQTLGSVSAPADLERSFFTLVLTGYTFYLFFSMMCMCFVPTKTFHCACSPILWYQTEKGSSLGCVFNLEGINVSL